MKLQPAYGGAAAATEIQASQIADGVIPNAVRTGAMFGTSSGNHAAFSWTLTAGASWRVSWKAAPVGALVVSRVWGFSAVNTPACFVASNGSLSLQRGGSSELSSPAGTYLVDGQEHEYALEGDAATLSIYRDGVLMATGPSAGAWTTGTMTMFIGSYAAGQVSRTERLWDFRFEDRNSAPNTAYFPLDKIDDSGNFANEHPGSTVADATVTGFVGFALVQGLDGGKPVRAGGGYIARMERGSTDQALDGSVSDTHVLTFEAAPVDETGGADAALGVWTAPAPGMARVTLQGRFSSTTAADSVYVLIYLEGVWQFRRPYYVTAGEDFQLDVALRVAAGDDIWATVDSIESSNVGLNVDFSQLLIVFTPS